MRNLLLNRNFSLVWIGQFVSQIGDKFYGIALAWWILAKSGSPSTMGFYLMASALPGLAIGPLAGSFVDRWNRRTILVAADLVRGGAVLAVAMLSAAGSLLLWHVFAAGVIISLASAFFNPAVVAMLPRLVEGGDLPRANALNQLISGISMVLGPAAGAAAIGLAGYTAVFLGNGISFLLSGTLIVLVQAGFKPSGPRRESLAASIAVGLRFILASRKVLIILTLIGLAHLYVGGLAVVMPLLARQLAGGGVQNLGFLQMAVGGGMALGSLLLHTRRRRGRDEGWLFGAMGLIGFGFMLIGALQGLGVASLPPYLGLMALVGLSVAVASVYWLSTLQVNVPDAVAGRVFAIAATLGNTSLPIAYGLFGVLLEVLSVGPLAAACGAGLIATSLALGGIFRRAAWSTDSGNRFGPIGEDPLYLPKGARADRGGSIGD